MQELLLERIRTDGGVQSRERINEEYVAELAELIKAGTKLPPIDVHGDGTDVWCADGFHRVLAHQQAGRRTIRCNVHKGGRQDAAWASCAANQEHGLRRTNADKRNAVEMALKMRPELSDEAVALHTGVSRDFVLRSRSQLRHQGVIGLHPATRVGKDGKTYRVPPPPTGWPAITTQPQGDTHRTVPPPPTETMPPPPCQGRTERQPDPEPDDQPGDTAQGRPFESPQARLDEVGKPIPDYLWEKWDRGAQMKEMASTISRVVGVIRRLHDNGDHLLLDENGQAIIAALETAGHGLKSNVPFAVCPYCNGILADRCRTCRGRGIIGKYRYENTVPREMRP